MNIFDIIIYASLIVAVIVGFRSGFLRSLATIFGYLATAPVAVLQGPKLNALLMGQFNLPSDKAWLGFAIIFLGGGFLLSALFRFVVDEITGASISILDHLLGAILGAVRVVLMAVLMVLIIDRIIPSEREPAWLSGSQLRPHLSKAGKMGLRRLPPGVEKQIDQIKRERHL